MLTATKQAKTGYWIDAIGKQVYSLEQINYFLYHHIDLVYRDFFSDALFDYIDKELEQPLMAKELRRLAAGNGKISDFLNYLFRESYYYNNDELARISELIARIDTMTKAERRKIQGDAHFRVCHYRSAVRCYMDILKHVGEEELSPVFYARTAYQVGVIYAKQSMCKSANTFFTLAYELSPDPAYIRACVYMSLLAEDDEELLSAIVRFKISDDALDSMKQRLDFMKRELEHSPGMEDFSNALSETYHREQLLEQWKSEYYEMLK